MHAAIILNGRKLIPVGAGFVQGAYVLVSQNDTYLIMPLLYMSGYRLRSVTQQWDRTFPSLEGAVAYVNTIEHAETEPGNAA